MIPQPLGPGPGSKRQGGSRLSRGVVSEALISPIDGRSASESSSESSVAKTAAREELGRGGGPGQTRPAPCAAPLQTGPGRGVEAAEAGPAARTTARGEGSPPPTGSPFEPGPGPRGRAILQGRLANDSETAPSPPASTASGRLRYYDIIV